jgi:hypothetical protein
VWLEAAGGLKAALLAPRVWPRDQLKAVTDDYEADGATGAARCCGRGGFREHAALTSPAAHPDRVMRSAEATRSCSR